MSFKYETNFWKLIMLLGVILKTRWDSKYIIVLAYISLVWGQWQGIFTQNY